MSGALQVTAEAGGRDQLLQFVSFTVEREEFAVEVGKVKEIIRLPEITRMPGTPGYPDGIFSLRGSVVPVISLRRRFGLDEVATDGRTRIIVLTIGSSVVGFKVDAVSEVIRVNCREIQLPPRLVVSGGDRPCVCGVINGAERMLVLLDPERLLPVGGLDLMGEAA